MSCACSFLYQVFLTWVRCLLLSVRAVIHKPISLYFCLMLLTMAEVHFWRAKGWLIHHGMPCHPILENIGRETCGNGWPGFSR
ncbi:hypothetical protein B0T22DRAFT_447048 [Podospora appendiculata]|uniref:Uncharacterized protein n=1 Tax=Podospora appendiculata TaxID=314037 RepID=A0AAE0XFB9_9PEZI|nr:hypothetical protein B0T22DRAFT_447048 [Podospora appendiculata]